MKLVIFFPIFEDGRQHASTLALVYRTRERTAPLGDRHVTMRCGVQDASQKISCDSILLLYRLVSGEFLPIPSIRVEDFSFLRQLKAPLSGNPI